GMRMKLSLALALSHKPELLILDEPTSGLDPVIRSELLEMFLEIIQDESCSILFSSHITSDIEKIADYVTIIDDGKIIMSDDKDLIMDKWKVIKADNEYRTEEICRRLVGVRKGEFGFSGLTDDLVSFAREFRNAFPGANFKTEKISMDELLVRVVKDGDC
ncbi:MAG TPA: AAA family ATPase, partial [Clostridia bacterium]|nr:AAA family ATPase [Clostridia bacterium]